METQELHRGRLIDHIQLVVRDLSAAQRFYTAIFESLDKSFEPGRPRLFPDDRARAWLKHNVEEVGNFEHFLPALYASQAQVS